VYQKDNDRAAIGAAVIAFLLLAPTLGIIWLTAGNTIFGGVFSVAAVFYGVERAYRTNQGVEFD
jgi:hypothetical protein